MIKKIKLFVALIAMMLIAAMAVNVNILYKSDKSIFSDLLLANAEALAGAEHIGGGWWSHTEKGYAYMSNGVDLPCCIPSDPDNACNFDSVGCLWLQ